jgi:hypothetical protein
MKKLDISYSDSELEPIVKWCGENKEYTPVITKYNKKGNWKAISLKGYAVDPLVISKPNVLGVGEGGSLQETPLFTELNIPSILDKIPAETERVRLMKLEAGTKLSKHTDKVDKEIKNGEIVRLHIPIITNEQVTMITWLETKIPTKFKMKKGECWWLDVSKPHQVLNESEIDRVHLVIDVYVNNFITEALQ